jgi:hypothetical protein
MDRSTVFGFLANFPSIYIYINSAIHFNSIYSICYQCQTAHRPCSTYQLVRSVRFSDHQGKNIFFSDQISTTYPSPTNTRPKTICTDTQKLACWRGNWRPPALGPYAGGRTTASTETICAGTRSLAGAPPASKDPFYPPAQIVCGLVWGPRRRRERAEGEGAGVWRRKASRAHRVGPHVRPAMRVEYSVY